MADSKFEAFRKKLDEAQGSPAELGGKLRDELEQKGVGGVFQGLVRGGLNFALGGHAGDVGNYFDPEARSPAHMRDYNQIYAQQAKDTPAAMGLGGGAVLGGALGKLLGGAAAGEKPPPLTPKDLGGVEVRPGEFTFARHDPLLDMHEFVSRGLPTHSPAGDIESGLGRTQTGTFDYKPDPTNVDELQPFGDAAHREANFGKWRDWLKNTGEQKLSQNASDAAHSEESPMSPTARLKARIDAENANYRQMPSDELEDLKSSLEDDDERSATVNLRP